MNAAKKSSIIAVLANVMIEQNKPKLQLPAVNDYLSSAGIDTDIDGGVAPVVWLKQHFTKDFYISNSGEVFYIGKAFPAARNEKVVEAIVLDKLRTGERVLCAKLPGILKLYGLQYQDFSNGMGMEEWIKKTFRSIGVADQELVITKQTAIAPLTDEYRQMEAVIQSDTLDKNFSWLQKFSGYTGDTNELKNRVAASFWSALTGQSTLYAKEENDLIAAAAFETDIPSEKGNAIYGVMEREVNTSSQQWKMVCFCCPKELTPPTNVQWLLSQIGTMRAVVAEILEQVENITAQRDFLLSRLSTFEQQLKDGCVPDKEWQETVSAYYQAWRALMTNVASCGIMDANSLTLSRIVDFFDNNASSNEVGEKILSEFGTIVAFVNKCIEAQAVSVDKTTPSQDLETFGELLNRNYTPDSYDKLMEIISYYEDLLKVMSAKSANNVSAPLGAVYGHFSEMLPIPVLLIDKQEEEYAPLTGIHTVRKMLETYKEIFEKAEDKPETTADELKEGLLNKGEEFVWLLPSYLRALFPDDKALRGIAFQEDGAQTETDAKEVDTRDLTPFGIASRLYNAVGNRNGLAEKYFLLGLSIDKERCGKMLLSIYREADDYPSFRTVWTAFDGQSYATEDDIVFWTLKRAELTSDLSECVDEIYEILEKHPELLKNREFNNAYASVVTRLPGVSDAHIQWLSHANITLNQFETAVADNNLDSIFSMLDEQKTLLETGYTENELNEIHGNLKKSFATGLDDYSKGKRLFAVQGNKNRAAEKYFWQSTDPRAKIELFRIYFDAQDYASALWIAELHITDAESQIIILKDYVDCLLKTNEADKLDSLSVRYPEIWYLDGVLDLLATVQKPSEFIWSDLAHWHAEHPIQTPNPFEKALAKFDEKAVIAFAENPDELSHMGYSPEQIRAITSEFRSETSCKNTKELAQKIFEIQGNAHRFYESLLMSEMASDREWAVSYLYALFVEEARYNDVFAYYRTYECLRESAENYHSFLWSLIALEKHDLLFESLENNFKGLNRDIALLNRIIEIAESEGRDSEITILRRKLALNPQNRFEENLFHLNNAVLQEYISMPSLLESLGYNWDQIERIRGAFTKPFMEGNSGYGLADRIRKFLGDERSEQFLLESEADARSAKSLFDIYTKQKRWDDLCYLYRRHDASTTWNDHYAGMYKKALSSAVSKENCEEYLKLLETASDDSVSAEEFGWVYLRTLLGAERFEEAQEYEDRLLAENAAIRFECLIPYYDLAWAHSEETQKYALRFSGKILHHGNTEPFTSEEIKMIVSANGHLTSEPENAETWEAYLFGNHLDNVVFYLNVYFAFFIADDPAEKEQFYRSLMDEIDALDMKQMNLRQLMPYFEAYKNLESENLLFASYTKKLRTCFMNLAERIDLVDANDFGMILYVARSGMITRNQVVDILKSIIASVNAADNDNEKYVLTLYATYLIVETLNNNAETEEDDEEALYEVCNDIADEWKNLIESGFATFEEADWPQFLSFINSTYIEAAQANQLGEAWIEKAKEEPENTASLARLYDLISIKKLSIRGDRLCDYLVSVIHSSKNADISAEADLLIAQCLKNAVWDNGQLETIINALQTVDAFAYDHTNTAVETILQERDPAKYYKWIKQELIFFTEDDSRKTPLFTALLSCVKDLQLSIEFESEDYQLLYEAVCNNPTVDNLTLLYKLFENAGRQDQADIIAVLLQDALQNSGNYIYHWMLMVLNERDAEWIERYSKWWQGLIHLTEEDQQIKSAIAYLGLSDEPINESTLNSLSRLLMSDIYNLTYIRCYMRVMTRTPALSENAVGKLSYLAAVSDPDQLVASIKNCFANKQYDLGLQLLRREMEVPITNSVSLGQLLGDIYTAGNVEACPELFDCLPEIYDWIGKMNEADPKGEWKNFGRAVDIAKLTNSEELLLTKFREILFPQHPGRVATTIISLIKKQEFDSAYAWLEIALQYTRTPYYSILENVLSECKKTGSLSKTDELKLATIPPDGNMRSMEFFGEYVFRAFEQGLKAECLDAMEYLFDIAKTDKAYLSTLISLYCLKPVNQANIVNLYNLLKQYFRLTQDDNVMRVARMLAIVHTCITDECDEKDENVYAFCNQERPLKNNYSSIVDLELECQSWIDSAENRDIVKQIMISSVTGCWELNPTVLEIIRRNNPVVEKLVALFPEAFCAGCVGYALQNRQKSTLQSITKLLTDFRQFNCAKSIRSIDNLSPESVENLAMILEVPIEIPGTFYGMIKNILTRQEQQPNDVQFESELTIAFSLLASFNYALYSNDRYGIQELVNSMCSDYNRTTVLGVLTRISTYALEASGELGHPYLYLKTQEYLMMITSAERYQEKTPAENTFLHKLFATYILLGKLMKGLLSPQEIKKISLENYINMTNLMCQNGNAYKDLSIVMDYCPAKWKICLRCMQELIQGCPRNVLFVMNRDEFWTQHKYCAAFVERMTRDFVSATSKGKGKKKSKGQELLIKENKRYQNQRDANWGIITKADIRSAGVLLNKDVTLFNIFKRNLGHINEFRDDIDVYLEELREEEAKKAAAKQTRNASASEAKDAYSETEEQSDKDITAITEAAAEFDFRKIGFVTEAIDEWKNSRLSEADAETPEEKSASDNKVDEILQDLTSNRDMPNVTLRRLCVDLGLALFDRYCEHQGLNTIVTEQARTVLFETANCVSDNMDSKGLSFVVRTYVQMCIESYADLSALVEACMPPALMTLCNLIVDDYEVRKAFKAHINQLRQIGSLLSNPMTPAERLSALEKQISICRSSQNNLNSSLKQHLISLINKEISDFREIANVTIEVYNTQGAVEEGSIFGRIQNAGNQTVKNVRMDLNINGVYHNTYSLPYLEGKSMVPFELRYITDEDEQKLAYSLKAHYETADGKKEETREVSGTLTLIDPEEDEHRFAVYQTTRPAGKEDYIERVKIQTEISTLYPAGGAFEVFPTLAIYGMRRTGKSSVLKKLERTLYENFGENILFAETSGEGATAGSLTHAVHSMLVRQVLKNKGDGYQSLSDYYADNADWVQFVEKWQNAPADSADYQWVEDFYSELSEKFLQSKKLIVLIDEVDKMYGGYEKKTDSGKIVSAVSDNIALNENLTDGTGDQASQTNLWGIFSRITQRQSDPVRFVLCGSDYFTNSMIEGDNLTQFFQRIQKIRVGRMSRNELVLSLTSLLEKDTDIEFHQDTIPYLWSLCDGLPWHAKLIINDIISTKLISENRNIIYPSDVMASAGIILSSGLISTENNFGVIALRDEERQFITILAKKAETMNTFVPEEEIYREFCKTVQEANRRKSFDRAKKLLVSERQLIVSRDGADGPKYRFGCELYRLFNRGEKYITQQFQLR